MALRTTNEPIFVDFEGRVGAWSGTTPPASYSDPLELSEIDLTPPEQETVRLIGRRTSTQGTAIHSTKRATGAVSTVSLKTATYSPGVLALAMGATVSETTQANAAVADEEVDLVLGVWVPLANYAIAAHGTGTEISLKDAADATVTVDARTLDEATRILDCSNLGVSQYQVDLELGMIRATHSNAAGAGMQVSYDADDRTWEQYDGGAAVDVYWHITGSAKNVYTGKVGILDIWYANVAPTTAFRVPSGDAHFETTFQGDLATPPAAIRGITATKPYRFRNRTA